MNKLSKNINSKFVPTYMTGIPMYGFGSWLKDAGLLMADNMMSVWGGKNIIKDSAYSNKIMSKISGVSNKFNELGTGIAAGVLAPGIGNQLVNGVQSNIGNAVGADNSIENSKVSPEQMLLNNQQLLNSLPTQQQYSYANGGELLYSYSPGGEITDRITSFDTGSLHSENGGIPLGQNALVERDEFMYTTKDGKKYIFSNKF